MNLFVFSFYYQRRCCPYQYSASLCVMIYMCEADEDSREKREDVCLHECDEHLKAVHEQEHDGTEEVQSDAVGYSHRPSEEDDACE